MHVKDGLSLVTIRRVELKPAWVILKAPIYF